MVLASKKDPQEIDIDRTYLLFACMLNGKKDGVQNGWMEEKHFQYLIGKAKELAPKWNDGKGGI